MKTPAFLKRLERKLRWKKIEAGKFQDLLQAQFDANLMHQAQQVQANSPNPLNRFGRKCFSQTDEDGITLEILRRIGGVQDGVFAEIGVGDGMENNTLILAALGWKGCWIGGEVLRPSLRDGPGARLRYLREWVTLDNIVALCREGLKSTGREAFDVISLDLDGNDIYLAEAMLAAGFTPKLFIVEYNAKFPPPVEFQIDYDAGHVWQNDDYFGASLASYVKLFERFGYRLVCCNAHSGANAFFVRDEFAPAFDDVPTDTGSIYMEPRYWLYGRHGHQPSVRTVEKILNGG